ncbi:MAG: hypothetical protein WBN38_05440 [Polyangiales bacterium]
MFRIDVSVHTGQFAEEPPFEEVGEKAPDEYALPHGDAESVEHFL